MTTLEQKFRAAWAATKRDGVIARLNVESCCRSCITYDMLGLDGEDTAAPYVWTFAGQGNRITWREDLPYYAGVWERHRRRQGARRPDPITSMSIYHGGEDTTAATTMVMHLLEQGLTVSWDGTKDRAITLFFDKF